MRTNRADKAYGAWVWTYPYSFATRIHNVRIDRMTMKYIFWFDKNLIISTYVIDLTSSRRTHKLLPNMSCHFFRQYLTIVHVYIQCSLKLIRDKCMKHLWIVTKKNKKKTWRENVKISDQLFSMYIKKKVVCSSTQQLNAKWFRQWSIE